MCLLPGMETVREQLDKQFDAMQTPEAREAMQKAFEATPEELGKAAVKLSQWLNEDDNPRCAP